jgi:lysophospholipase L1-like esterase
MTRITSTLTTKTANLAATFLVAALIAVPVFAQRGSANFTRFVALGDSYGAGFESGSLNDHHQVWSWPAIIARQMGKTLCPATAKAADDCFAQPLVTFPGIANELVLQNILTPSPVIAAAPGTGLPVMTTFGRAYDNLSIPGNTVGSLLTITGAEPPTPGEPTPVSFGRFILRGQGTAIQQAASRNPTFIALWIGGNDYLNVAFSGTTVTMTSAADFKTRYEAILDSLIAGASGAGIVVGNLPAPAGLVPYLTLIPPFLVDPATRQPVLIGGQPVPFIADLGNGVIGPIPPTTLIPLHVRDKLAQGYGLPPALKNIPPFSFLPHTGEPLSANDILTAQEIATVVTRVGEYNTIIQNAASSRNIPIANVKGLFDRASAPGGIPLGPISVNNGFITGGFFSLDGFHLTDLGYLLMANEFIAAINSGYKTAIPAASVAELFANNGAFFPDTARLLGPISFSQPNTGMTDQAVKQIVTFWAQPTVRRMRAVGH